MARWVVCAAWPYVNAVPHLGTLIGSVLSADVYARYLRSKGDDVVFVSGSDEHGTPIEVEARRRGIKPKELTDQVHEYVSNLFKKFQISFDNYTRTESPVHKGFVRDFLLKVYKNGYVFTKTVELPYCPKCRMFLPDRFIVGTCPYCKYPDAKGDQCDNCGRLLEPTQLIDARCVFCGSPPEIKETKHWYFDLPQLEGKLKSYIEEHPRLPANVKKFCLNWIKEGLKPRALTRDNEWGIPAPFPGAEGKTVYVWFDALLGYISATKEYGIRIGDPDLWTRYWLNEETRTIFFIGKDNIPFHAIILPALLMASEEGYVLPWQVAATEYLTFAGEKFSKSRGIGVWADEALMLLDVDYWRFALVRIRPELRDANFTWPEFVRIVNSDMNDDIGNFAHRALMFIARFYDHVVPEPGPLGPHDRRFEKAIKEAPRRVGEFIEEARLKPALEEVLRLARLGNQYINLKRPWEAIKVDKRSADTTMWLAANCVRTLAILLHPVAPSSAERLWEALGLEGSPCEVPWSSAEELAVRPGHRIGTPRPPFSKLPEDFTAKVDDMLRDVRRRLNRPKVIA